MNTAELSAFVKTVEMNSFSLAANSLYLTQSALSQQIQRLERGLGFALFEHSQRKAVLTPAGERFYVRAKQMLALCRDAQEEGLYLSRLAQHKLQRLQIGCLNSQFIRYWLDLLALTAEVSQDYAPRPVRYESRAALLSSIVAGETDLSLQMECSAIRASHLEFIPVTTVREVCQLLHHNAPTAPLKSELTVEDLLPYTLAFHNPPGGTLFEDALRGYIKLHSPQTKILEPRDFFDADYEPEKIFLVPSPQFCRPRKGWCLPLNFEGNIRLGFVVSPNCSARVLSFIEYVQKHLPPGGDLWGFENWNS